MAKHQYNAQVKLLVLTRIFDDNKCINFFNNQSIIHQISCVNRPQSTTKCTAERKHINILEMAILPLHFRGDCVLAVVYLVNRLPPIILNNSTPFKILHKKSPYAHLKVSGCLVISSSHKGSNRKSHCNSSIHFCAIPSKPKRLVPFTFSSNNMVLFISSPAILCLRILVVSSSSIEKSDQ